MMSKIDNKIEKLTEKQNRIARTLWDTNLTPEQFLAIINGSSTVKWPDRGFCMAQLLESTNWFEIQKVLDPESICKLWHEAKKYIRSNSIKEGMDFACRILREDFIPTAG